jgi:hypothetical protein
MPETKRPLKVFLCHAHADRDTVHALYTRLTKDGVDTWLDKAKLLPGQDWEYEIRRAVRESDVVVVCLSKQFNQAGFRQKEVRLALDTAMEKQEGEIFIIPARLEECDTLESLRKWHWVDLFEGGYEMLLRALRARADRIGATLQIKRSRSLKVKTPSKKNVSEMNSKTKNGQEMRMFYDLTAHFECDIENTTPETLANFLLESLTRIMRTVSVVNKSDDNRTVEYRTDQIEYFDPKHGKTIQHALIVHGKKLQLIGKGDFRGVESLTTVLNLLVITITQGVNGSRLRFDSDNIPVESFKELVQGILWDFGKDISALERTERKAAEKVAREKVEKESAERAQLELEELARQKIAKEREERRDAEKDARESAEKKQRADRDIFDQAARDKAEELARRARLEGEKRLKEKNAKKQTDVETVEKVRLEVEKQESLKIDDIYAKIKPWIAYGGAISIGLFFCILFILVLAIPAVEQINLFPLPVALILFISLFVLAGVWLVLTRRRLAFFLSYTVFYLLTVLAAVIISYVNNESFSFEGVLSTYFILGFFVMFLAFFLLKISGVNKLFSKILLCCVACVVLLFIVILGNNIMSSVIDMPLESIYGFLPFMVVYFFFCSFSGNWLKRVLKNRVPNLFAKN